MPVRRETNKQAAQGLRAITNPDNVVGKVGWFETAVYPSGTPVALVAAVQEYGWPEHNIPPRLGFRATAERLRSVWGEVMKGAAKQVVDGKHNMAWAMEVIGLKAAGDQRKHITEVQEPPLAEATIAARIHGKKKPNLGTASKPLVDTGHLLTTLTNVVEQA